MSKRLNLIGQKFGRLLVLEFAGMTKEGKSQWLCKCDCKKEKIIGGGSLKRGLTKSCGCLSKEKHFKTHGMKGVRFYKKWQSAKDRCLNKNATNYKHYGGRGITICDKWLNFEGFYDNMYDNEDPNKSYIKHCEKFGENNTTLDRIDNNKGYCKENCRWATLKEQANNRRNNRLIFYQEKIQTLSEWAKEYNLTYACLSNRLNVYNWPIKKAFETPVKK